MAIAWFDRIHTTEIIDLDQQSITFIDHDKHSYSATTFQQMKQAMTNAMAKAKEQGVSTSTQQPASSDGQMNFDAHVTSNGTTRTIDGLQAKEALVTITMLANAKANDGTNVNGGMAATSEMWLVPEIPGMDELRAFNQRMMQELSVDATANQMSGLLAAQPGGAEALADLKKEASKMQGFPVFSSHARWYIRGRTASCRSFRCASSCGPGQCIFRGKCDSRSGYRYRHADCQRRSGKARDIRARTGEAQASAPSCATSPSKSAERGGSSRSRHGWSFARKPNQHRSLLHVPC